jgi:hydrogenase maturation factor HypF (carbamoyltransferase family)
MKSFKMCDACAREYLDPEDRRFHAETLRCIAPRNGSGTAKFSQSKDWAAITSLSMRATKLQWRNYAGANDGPTSRLP